MDEQTQTYSTQDGAQVTIDASNLSTSPNYGQVVGVGSSSGGVTGIGGLGEYTWSPISNGDDWNVGYINTDGSYYNTATLADITYNFTSSDLDKLKKVLSEVEKQLNNINDHIKTAPLEHLELWTQFKDSMLGIRRSLRDLLVDCQLADYEG